MSVSTGIITEEHKRQFEEEGYFILEKVIPEEDLQIIRDSCAHLIDLMHQEMDRLGTDHIHISHRGKRYHIAKKYDQAPRLTEYVFGDLMAEICKATIGDTAYLFYDQYVVKAAEKGIKFSWHQDSGYVKAFDPATTHTPYLTCWCALDDMTEANGTISVLPHDVLGTRNHIFDHEREEGTNDLIGYAGAESGEVITMGAGSIAVFSSTSLHRSGPNTTDQQRRVYLTQYSSSPLTSSTGGLWAQAVPFITQGEVVYSKEDDFDESTVSPRLRKTIRAELAQRG